MDYPKMFNESLKQIRRHARLWANSPKTKEVEINILSRAIKNLSMSFRMLMEKIDEHELEKAQYHYHFSKLLDKIESLKLILKLMGVTDKGLQKLEKYPMPFLKMQLEQVQKTGEYFQHPISFDCLRLEYIKINALIEFDLCTINNYILFHQLYHNLQKEEVKNRIFNSIQSLKSENPHLRRFFQSIDIWKKNGIGPSGFRDDYYLRELVKMYFNGKI